MRSSELAIQGLESDSQRKQEGARQMTRNSKNIPPEQKYSPADASTKMCVAGKWISSPKRKKGRPAFAKIPDVYGEYWPFTSFSIHHEYHSSLWVSDRK
jgi:hypothetical protein